MSGLPAPFNVTGVPNKGSGPVKFLPAVRPGKWRFQYTETSRSSSCSGIVGRYFSRSTITCSR